MKASSFSGWLTRRCDLGRVVRSVARPSVRPDFIARYEQPGALTQTLWLGGLLALLTVQVLPGVMTLTAAGVAEAQNRKQEQPVPEWARARIGQGPQGVNPKNIPASQKLSCVGDDCSVDMRALDLSRPPTEKELRRAGQLGGALSPIGEADPDKIAAKEDLELKAMGIASGINTPDVVPGPAGKEIKRRKDKVRRARAMNLEFGAAMQEWNKHNFRHAAAMFKQYLQDYPATPATADAPADAGTPWAGEAELHLGCDAKCNGQFAEAENVFSTLASSTSDDPKDPSFDINQKAKARWADLDIALGRLDSASEKLKNLLQTDTDWRRRTWAQSWLLTIDLYKNNARDLRACGPQALAVLLADIGDKSAAKEVAAIKGAPRAAGYSLAEVGALARKEGVPMTGFAASSVEALETMPTPFIVHYDFHRSGAGAVSFDARGRRAPVVKSQKESTQFKIGYHLGLPTAQTRAMAKKHDPFRVVSGAPGHFLVVRQVNKATKTVTLYDPIVQRIYYLSYEALGREWSGKGLAIASKVKTNAPKVAQAAVEGHAPVRVAWLGQDEMKRVFGGCCGHYSAGLGEGCDKANQGCNGNCGGAPAGGAGGNAFNPIRSSGNGSASPHGSPILSVNRYSLNVYIVDTPLWYKPAMGPSVDLTLSYNSQDSLSQSNPFGNKWMFSYGSYITEDTGAGTAPSPYGPATSGATVTIFMPDGKKKSYAANGQGGFTPPAGDHSVLTKTGNTHYELKFEGGDTAIFDIPQGTTSLQPFLIELRDRWGKSLRIGYNQKVKPVTLTDALGQVTTLRYDANDHVTSVWDPFGRSAKFTYDANNNLVQCVDMEGNAFQYVYDYNGNIKQLLTAQGPWNIGNVWGDYWTGLQVTDPAGHGETWGYSGYAAYSYTDKRGVKVDYNVGYIYGGQPQVTTTANPDNTSAGQSIDSATGLPYAITDARGHSTHISYNAMGQPTAITDSTGNTARFTYAANSVDVTSISNALGAQVGTFTYDAYHQPITANDANGQTTRYTYTNWGAPASVTDGQGHVTAFNYNAGYRLANLVRDGVTLGRFTYDDIGRVQTRTDARGHTLSYEYNNLDKVTRISFDDGTYITYDYVCCGLVGVTRDRAGRLSYTDYDALKRLTRTQDAMGRSLTYSYDNNGNLIKLVDASGNTTRWGYDNSNRVTAKAYADGGREAWAYPTQSDSNGSNTKSLGIVEHTNSRGETSSLIYDDNNNLAKIDYADPNTPDVSLTYNELNKPTAMQDALGVTRFSYDNLGRLTAIAGPWNNDGISYSYNAQGQRQTLSVGKGATAGADVTGYNYDALGRLSQISNGGQTWGYGYEGVTGLIKQLNLPDGERSVYSYDAFDRLTQLANVRGDGSNVSTYSYAYDEGNPNAAHRPVRVGLTSQIGNEAPTTTSWGYDNTDQLTSENLNFIGENGGAQTQNRSYSYDSMSNRTGSTKTETKSTGTTTATSNYANNALNQTTATLFTSGQDALSSDLTYDSEGNLSQVHSNTSDTRYAYDEANRLISVTSLANGANVSKTTFVYDGLSRRRITREFAWQNNAWQQTSEKRSLYDGMNVVQERDGANAVKVSYVRGQDMGGGIGGLLARSDADGRAFYHYDGRGNVTQLTNAAGVAVVRYLYDAFGNTVEARGGALATANVFRFSTKEVVAGMYDYGFRFYSPSLGKWINRDPLAEQGGVNLYAFVHNNSIRYFDSTGLTPVEIGVMLGAVGVGFAAGALANLAGQLLYHHGNLKCVDWWSVIWAGIFGALQALSTVLKVLPPTLTEKIGEIAVGAISGAATAAYAFAMKEETKDWGTVAGGGSSSFNWGGFGQAVAVGAASGATAAALSMLFPGVPGSHGLPGGTSLSGVLSDTFGAATGEEPCTPTNPPIWPTPFI